MAGGHSDYQRGTMKVDAQSGTFSGFMGGTKYGGALIALFVIWPTLVFAVNLHWVPSLIATVFLGFILGAVMKFKGGWYVGLIGLAILVAFFSFLITLVA